MVKKFKVYLKGKFLVSIVLVYFSSVPFLLGQKIQPKLDSILTHYFQKNEFSGSVLVAKKGKVLYQNALGYANVETKEKNKANTKFLIGSATKSFTAIAIMILHEKGFLDLHKPIREYLPELQNDVGDLTLHLLMKNSSGLPVHLNRITKLEYRDISSQELLELYQEMELEFTPGSTYAYSNLNYQLAALVLERLSGLQYKSFLRNEIFEPVKMSNTGIERTGDQIPNKALGHDVLDGKIEIATPNYMAFAKGGGDMYSTIGDLLKWDQALYSSHLLTLESMKLLFDGKANEYGSYGYGFKVKKYKRNNVSKPSGKLVRHGGSMYGYSCNIHRYLDDQVLIVILGNIRPYPVMKITKEIESQLYDFHYL